MGTAANGGGARYAGEVVVGDVSRGAVGDGYWPCRVGGRSFSLDPGGGGAMILVPFAWRRGWMI
jgi:hypothetical protein